jgi:hypothetical protein
MCKFPRLNTCQFAELDHPGKNKAYWEYIQKHRIQYCSCCKMNITFEQGENGQLKATRSDGGLFLHCNAYETAI